MAIFPVGQTSRRSCCWCCRRKTRDRNSVHDGYYQPGTRGDTQQYYHPSTGLIDLEDSVFLVPVRPLVQNRQETRHIPKQVAKHMGPQIPPSPKEANTPRNENMMWQNVVHDVVDENNKQKKAKELNTWMPHSHPVRQINTSTK